MSFALAPLLSAFAGPEPATAGTPGKRSRSEQLPGGGGGGSVVQLKAGGRSSTSAADDVYSLHLESRPKARPTADYEPRDAEIALQRILAEGSLEEVTRTRAALRKAKAERSTDDPDPLTARVELTTEPDVVDLDASTYLVAPRTTDEMIRVMSVRIDELLGMRPDPAWAAFATAFNREFASVLNAFDLVDDVREGQRNDVVAIRLQYLFTDAQRAMLTDFFSTNQIPEGLFNGDERGRTTAQQRILLAGEILARGEYRPGSFDQRVHALACYHWARIVHHYAGATSRGLSTGMSGNFDHAGNAVLATATTEEPLHASEDPSLEVPAGSYQDQKHGDAAWRYGIASWELVMTLEPGDWIYIYNANSSISGAHSVIFAGWEGAPDTDEKGRHYRPAHVLDQGSTGEGGRSRSTLLGSDIFMLGDRAVKPVSQITRVNTDANAADTVDALTPDITGDVKGDNKRFIRRLAGMKANQRKVFDVAEMNGWLRAQSVRCIDALLAEGRLTDRQWGLLMEAAATDDNHTLVCLYQRVLQMAANSDALDRNEDKAFARLDPAHAKAEAAQEAKTDAVEDKIDPLEQEARTIELTLYPLEVRLDALDQSDEIKELYAAWRRLRKERKALPKGDPARADLRAEEEKLEARIDELEAIQHERKAEIKELRRTIKSLSADERRLETKIDRLREKLKREDPTADIHGLVHGGSRKQTIDAKVSGAFEDIPGTVPWSTFMK